MITEHEIRTAIRVLEERINYLKEHEPYAYNEIDDLERALVAIQGVPLSQFKPL